ncbi:methyltransferase domain-containing protein [Candidatus Poribacteria bacterium]|nr:methyltransferase domain-containing protein [Candidatus Poribacteria bacterium]
MQITYPDKAQSIISMYSDLSTWDKLTIMSRVVFCMNPIVEFIDEYMPETGLILDIGCGYGVFSVIISQLRPEISVLGVDMSSRRIQKARSIRKHMGNMIFLQDDITNFSFPECSGILLIDILSMLDIHQQLNILDRCYKGLESGGILLIRDNSKSPYWKYLYAYIEEILKTKIGVYGKEVRKHASKYWNIKEFLKVLNKAGFQAKAIPEKSYLPYPGVIYVCQKKT